VEGRPPQLSGGTAVAEPGYGAYDRVLDWFSDHRMAMAKGFVLLAVVAILGGLVLAIAVQL
jgi:hypothetical protein